jgi:uncharacterized protein with PIN domain
MVRSKAWLRAVASLDCQICGISGMTQAAHANWGVYGKGMGQKAHDCFTAALCQHCHHEIDQGKELTKEERREQWETAFRSTLVALCKEGLISAK